MSLSTNRYRRLINAKVKDSGKYEVIAIAQAKKHLRVEVKFLGDGDRFFVRFPVSPSNTNAAEKGVMKTVKMAHRAKCSGCCYQKAAS